MPRKKAAPRPRPPQKTLRDQATKDLARMMKMYFADGDLKRAKAWWDRLGDRDPARALELYIEMAKYSKRKPQ